MSRQCYLAYSIKNNFDPIKNFIPKIKDLNLKVQNFNPEHEIKNPKFQSRNQKISFQISSRNHEIKFRKVIIWDWDRDFTGTNLHHGPFDLVG